MRQFSVLLADEGWAVPAHRTALASLPAHFRVVSGGIADVAVSVSSADLPAGLRAAVVADPGAARAAAVPVFPAWPFLPRLEADACFLAARHFDVALIGFTITVAGAGIARLRTALLEQLAVLRSLTGRDPVIQALARNDAGYTASADFDATIVALSAVVSPLNRDTFRLSAVGGAERLDVTMDADANARPASIRLFGPDGMREALPTHQSSHRLTWAKVHAFLSDQQTVLSNNAVSEEDLACVSRWLGAPS